MRKVILSTMVSIFLAGEASAAVITFTSRSAWEAAVASRITTLTFEGIAPSGGGVTVPDLVLSGVDFGRATVEDPGVGSFIGAWGSGAMLFSYGQPNPARISFGTPVSALGFDYGATLCIVVGPCAAGGVNVSLSTGETVQASGPMPPLQFIGVVSSVPITSLGLEITPTLAVIDNFSFAEADPRPAPEPGAIVLLGLSLIGVAVRLRRQERAGWARQSIRWRGERGQNLAADAGTHTGRSPRRSRR